MNYYYHFNKGVFSCYVLFLFLIFVLSCEKKSVDPAQVPEEPTIGLSRGPAPAGMQKLTATIDSKYNLEGDKIFALVDTYPGDTVAIVDPKTVSISLLDLLPSYAALDYLQGITASIRRFASIPSFLVSVSTPSGISAGYKAEMFD